MRCRYADHYAAAQAGAEARLAERSRQRPQLEVTLPLAGSANRPRRRGMQDLGRGGGTGRSAGHQWRVAAGGEWR